MAFKFGWVSCERRNRLLVAGYAIKDLACKFAIALDDTPYCNTPSNVGASPTPLTSWGSSTLGVNETSTLETWQALHNQMRNNPGWKQLLDNMPVKYMPGDHDVGGGNDWDHTIKAANGGVAPGINTNNSPIGRDGANAYEEITDDLAGQNIVNGHFAIGIQAAKLYMTDNSPNNDSEAVAEYPSAATTHSATPNLSPTYDPNYYREQYDISGNLLPEDTSNAHFEIFYLDTTTHKAPVSADGVMLGTAQKDWIKNRVVSSTATLKLIASPKITIGGTDSNNDDFPSSAATEWAEISDYFVANGVVGIGSISGDRHVGQVNVQGSVLDGSTELSAGTGNDWVDVCGCPVGNDMWDTGSVVGVEMRWKQPEGRNSASGLYGDSTRIFGTVQIEEDYMEFQLRNADKRSADILWSGRIYSDSNKLTYPVIKLSI